MLRQNEAGGVENEADGRLTVRMSGRQLELSLSEQSDDAKYSCVAVNVAGRDDLHFNLQVLGLSSPSSSSSPGLEVRQKEVAFPLLAFPFPTFPCLHSNLRLSVPFLTSSSRFPPPKVATT